MDIPVVKPYKTKEYTFTQSKYEVAPKLPASMIISAPSGSGKNSVASVYDLGYV